MSGMVALPRSSHIRGTTVRVQRERVIDGHTIRVYMPNSSKPESLRILCLDTEDSFSFSSNPVTPWGKAAKAYANRFLQDQTHLFIEFPGNEPLEECVHKYRGNFGRLLVWVHRLDGVDFTERMIRLGYSPYFNKYGNADFLGHHRRYILAERDAQMAERGVWNQIQVNGRIIRNYARLSTWWELRAIIIDQYRLARKSGVVVYNSRRDFYKLREEAERGAIATIFTEVRQIRRTSNDEEDGSVGVVASIGSTSRPVQIFVPNIDSDEGKQIVELFRSRYMGTENQPRRGYCYVRGELKIIGRGLRITIERPFDVMDDLWMADEAYAVSKSINELDTGHMDNTGNEGGGRKRKKRKVVSGAGLVRISALLPDPDGRDRENETVTLVSNGGNVDLTGWRLSDHRGGLFFLDGSVSSSGKVITLDGKLILTNTGNVVQLLDAGGVVVHEVSYTVDDVKERMEIRF